MDTFVVWTTAPSSTDIQKRARTLKYFTVEKDDYFGSTTQQWREVAFTGTAFALAEQCDKWRSARWGLVTLDDPRTTRYGWGKTEVPTNK